MWGACRTEASGLCSPQAELAGHPVTWAGCQWAGSLALHVGICLKASWTCLRHNEDAALAQSFGRCLWAHI